MAINTPTGWDEELKSRLEWLTPEQKDRLFHILKEDVKKRYWERLYWNKDAILDDLRKNHVKHMDYEIWWHKWCMTILDLPPVWKKFKWFVFQCFRSYDTISKSEFLKNKDFVDMSYTKEEISNLFRAMNEYMKANWIYTDESMDYEHELREPNSSKESCKAWLYVEHLIWPWHDQLFLKNTKKRWGNKNSTSTIRNVHCGNCAFYWVDPDYDPYGFLLLKLPN